MKTIIEWFATIKDEGVRAEAVRNAVEDGSEYKKVKSLAEAYISGFKWKMSPQGHNYWDTVYWGSKSKEIKL